jgi:hypothetical protein
VQQGTNRPFGSSIALAHGLHADRRLGRNGATDACWRWPRLHVQQCTAHGCESQACRASVVGP